MTAKTPERFTISNIFKAGLILFTIGGVYASIDFRLRALESFKNTIDTVKVEAKLTQIQTDLEWIKTAIKNRQ